jgi:hypothetical protein
VRRRLLQASTEVAKVSILALDAIFPWQRIPSAMGLAMRLIALWSYWLLHLLFLSSCFSWIRNCFYVHRFD